MILAFLIDEIDQYVWSAVVKSNALEPAPGSRRVVRVGSEGAQLCATREARRRTRVLDPKVADERVLFECDGVGCLELLVPHPLCVVARRQLEHKLGLNAISKRVHYPWQVACEAVLLDLARTKLGEAVRDATRDGLRPVHLGVGAHHEAVLSILDVRGDASAKPAGTEQATGA